MLKYKQAQKIFDAVADDFRTYEDEDLINYSSLIKVVRECNATLSLKINPESSSLIDITDYKGKLPDNFETLSMALLCTKKMVNTTKPSGFHVEQITESQCKNPCSVCLEECEIDYKVVKKCQNEWTEFSDLDIVTIVNDTFKKVDPKAINFISRSPNEMKIQGDYIHTNFRNGTVYIEYVTNLEDEEGNLLVLDNPMTDPYYEYACKKHIIKTLYYNADDDVERKLDRISLDASRARAQAINFVNMIEYGELIDVFKTNREKFRHRFMKPFLDYQKNYPGRRIWM